MSLTVIVLIAGVLVVIALGAIVTGIFNKLVSYRNRYKNAFAQIEVQLKRRYHTLASLQPQCEVLLSMLAYAGQRDLEAAQNAFARAWQQLELPEARLRPADACGLDALDAALGALDEAAPRAKRQILHGAVTCITADRTVTAAEAELVRAIAASLGCPMPPLLLHDVFAPVGNDRDTSPTIALSAPMTAVDSARQPTSA